MSERRPTLLVFARGAAAESARRRLLPGALRGLEQRAHAEFLASALAAGEAAGCRRAVCSPHPLALGEGVAHLPQQGEDFGARVESAVAAAFAAGASPLLLAAADVPGLAARHLAHAAALLAEDPDRVVLGPSPDGGLYLIALARPIEGLGRATLWCRRDTLARLERTLARLGRPVVRLEPLRDLDRRADFEAWLSGAASSPLRALAGLLRAALAALAPAVPPALGLTHAGAVAVPAGRAPPSRSVR